MTKEELKSQIHVLVACEESQAVCCAFRALGFTAFSCDVQEPSGDHQEWHILGDAIAALDGGVITTMDGKQHDVGKWDLLIAHPPCTYLTSAGSVNLIRLDANGKRWANIARYQKMQDAVDFFLKFSQADIQHICVENPAPMHLCNLPSYSQIIEPYQFGHHWKKRTCLWLKNLPVLTPTNIVEPTGCWVLSTGRTNRTKLTQNKGVRSSKERSKTFSGIAVAMAEQWGKFLQEAKGETQCVQE